MAKDDWKPQDATVEDAAVETVLRQQHTGNHPDQNGPARRGEGADAHGGTRAGTEHVEPERTAGRSPQPVLSTRTRR